MFGPWIEIYTFFKSLVPKTIRPRRPHLSFITLHYIYIISLSLIASVILYGAKNLNYIDALFLGSGSATQSGLNTIDLAKLEAYQQVTIMLIACIANPIFINTFVVFIRLYWFEKRFQTVVLEAQRLRRTRERSRSKNDPHDEEARIGAEDELHIGPRGINVVHPGPDTMAQAEKPGDIDDSGTSSEGKSAEGSEEQNHATSKAQSHNNVPLRRDIAFADEPEALSRMETHQSRMPSTRSPDEHIAILEKQRRNDGTGPLYIPGPRDFDRGHVPQPLAEDINSPTLQQTRTREELPPLTPASGEHVPGRDHANEPRSPFGPRGPSNSILAPMASITEKMSSRVHFPSRSKNPTTEKGDDADDIQRLPRRDSSPEGLRRRGHTRTFTSFMTAKTEERDPMPYLSYQPTIGRNSAFVNLSESQREELGGIEYRALKLLATVLCCYYFGFHLLGMLSYVPWILRSSTYKNVLKNDTDPLPGWWGVFTAASMFNDLGFTLTPDSMISFQYAVWILLISSFLIVIGNTGFPCMLRFAIWMVSKVVPRHSALWEEFRFLLDHPRRCFTLLFPSTATWWLFWILFVLNGLDLMFFIILDLHDPVITSLPVGIRILDGWFQAASTRTAGFSVVNLADLHSAIQVSYLIMMYISVFPIAISVRRTNVYEEKSLGVYGNPQTSSTKDSHSNEQSYVGAHLRRQLSFDLWYVFLGLFIIAICEGKHLSNNDGAEASFSIFSVLFEVVSAYGTVGLSLGYPDTNTSFSAQFGTISKLVIIAMQIRGRHRGLPYALDKAVLLPSEGLQRKEEDEAAKRKQQRDALLSKLQTLDEAETVADGGVVGGSGGGAGHGRRDTEMAAQKSVGGGSGLTKLLSSALSAGPAFAKRRE